MQFLLYLIYIGNFWVVFPLKQPISAFIRGTGRISQLVFPPPGVITVEEPKSRKLVLYKSALSDGDTVASQKLS